MAINPTGPVSSPIITYATAAVRKAVGQETEEDKPRPLPPVEEGQHAEASHYRRRHHERIEDELPEGHSSSRGHADAEPEAQSEALEDQVGIEAGRVYPASRQALDQLAPPQASDLHIDELLGLAALGQKYKQSDGEK
ncbi:MAG: hypothetical protein RL336_368 [Pseudomonadota bacterium]|jgi:hypothetical protein